MRAAVVRSFENPPRYEEFTTPRPTEGQVLVDMLATGLHPQVRSGANGTHYTSDGRLPLIPGVDGVGRLPDGRRVYFVADDGAPGTMAEQALLDPRRSVPLPDDADPVTIAAAMNPAMSSWVALRRRTEFRPGRSILVLGATGNAGRMAVQIARHLGADRIVAAGRDPKRLALLTDLGATDVVSLAGDPAQSADKLAEAAADVDVVIDYTWGLRPNGPSPPCSAAGPIAALHWTGFRSAPWPGRTSLCLPPSSAPPICGSWAAGRAPSPPPGSSPNCRP
ncbi:zinc-binding alcohol dehydrogenase family protein [Streptomyces sp. NPDC005968]|uniref:quinone oxidoreductase family protein n=1 Tax=Streptomyces sp. NPDC005968 TaxID=3154574 RepID=UPI0034113058